MITEAGMSPLDLGALWLLAWLGADVVGTVIRRRRIAARLAEAAETRRASGRG